MPTPRHWTKIITDLKRIYGGTLHALLLLLALLALLAAAALIIPPHCFIGIAVVATRRRRCGLALLPPLLQKLRHAALQQLSHQRYLRRRCAAAHGVKAPAEQQHAWETAVPAGLRRTPAPLQHTAHSTGEAAAPARGRSR